MEYIKDNEKWQPTREEYVHDINDGEKPDADAFYRILSEHNYLSEVYITDEELANNFREIK